MDRIKNYIKHYYEKKLVSTELSNDEKKELDFLSNFIKTININDIYSIFNCNRRNFLLSVLSSSDKDKIFSLLKEKVEKIDNSIFSISNYKEVNIMYSCIIEFAKKRAFALARKIPFFDNNKENEEVMKLIEEKELLEEANELKSALKKYVKNEEQKEIILDLFLEYSYDLSIGLVAIAVINETQSLTNSDRLNPQILINNTYNNNIVSSIQQSFNKGIDLTDKKALSRVKDLIINYARVKDFYMSIKNRIDYLKKLPIEREKENSKINRKKDKILSYLDSLDLNKQIDLSNSFLELVDNEMIKYIIIERTIKHNLELQKETIDSIEKEKELSKLEILFKKSRFSIDNLNEKQVNNLIKYGNIDNIEKILYLFTDSEIKLNDNFPIYDILLLSKTSIVSNILKLYSASIISEIFINNNPEIFIEEIKEEYKELTPIKEPKYNLLNNNISQLKESKIDIYSLSKKDNSLLLMDSIELSSSLSLIQNYNLDYSKSNNYELLNDKSNIIIVDRFIELGLSDYIINHPHLITKKAVKRLKRMELCKMLGIPLVVDGKLNSKITNTEFKIGKNYISDDDIDKFVINSVPVYLDEKCYKILSENQNYNLEINTIDELEKYKTNKLEYNINGVIISRNKVLRNFQILTSRNETIPRETILLNSIIYGSILDEEQIKKINNEIFEPINNKKIVR